MQQFNLQSIIKYSMKNVYSFWDLLKVASNLDDINLLTVTGPPVGPFAIACLKQLYPILKLI